MKAVRTILITIAVCSALVLMGNGITFAQRPEKPGSPDQGFLKASPPPPSPPPDLTFRRAAEEALREYLELKPHAATNARLPIAYDKPQLFQALGMSQDEWPRWLSSEFGYAISYPSEWPPQEKADISQAIYTKVPSDVQFGDVVHLVVRIPRLDDETFERWTQAWQIVTVNNLPAHRWEAIIASPWDGEEFLAIQYVFRTPNADYLLSYGAPLRKTGLLDRFEQMVRTFRIIGAPAYHPPVGGQSATLAAVTDGFDFPVDPRDGSSGRPPWYASYNVQNPRLNPSESPSVCIDSNNDGRNDCWSPCYQKWLSQLQHTAEDWFRPAGSNVYAVANGRVIWAQYANWPGAVIIIEHTLPNGVSAPWGGNLIYSVYGHVDASSLPSVWSEVQRGQWIGRVYNWGDNSHVHLEMRRYGNMQQAPSYVNGYYFCTNAGWPGPGYTDTGSNPDWFGYTNPSVWIDGHRPGSEGVSCPSSGGVILYQHANYDCGGQGEGSGYLIRSGGGFQNVPPSFNDKASSIRIPTGWSVRLYENNDRGGGKRCINAPGDSDFSNDTFDNGVPLNDRVSSFEVFTSPDCAGGGGANRPPNTPQPTSPGDWYVARDGRAPTLCWQNNGDPDGDGFQFFAEVFESAVNARSGWISDTCWRPATLDGRYFGYQWRVKARDSRGAESDWSTVWHFTIEQPPQPPDTPWQAQYWDNRELRGSPRVNTTESGIYFVRHWGWDSGPHGLPADNWSARFVKTVYFPGGYYRFHCHKDDACRLYIDGQLRIDQWWDSSFEGGDWSGNLSAGNHEIKVEYYEHTGNAALEVWWQGPGYLPYDENCDQNNSWCAEYYINRQVLGWAAVRRSEGGNLWLDWDTGGPASTFPTDNFSTRFRRNVYFTCGTYRFNIFTDDGVRFWVDDVQQLNEWRDQVASFSVDVNLPTGVHNLRVEHYEGGGSAALHFDWNKLADCAPSVTVDYASTHYVQPGSTVDPAVKVQVTGGYLDGGRGDHLAFVGGSAMGAASTQPVYGLVNEGSTYTFDVVNSSDFRMTAPLTEGTYDSLWQVNTNGDPVGPEATVRVVVDETPPSISIQNPTEGTYLNGDTVTLQASPQDANGIDQVQFFVGYDDGSGWAWHNLGWDLDGSDGWSQVWDASGVPDQRGITLYAYAWDRAGNGAGAAAWDVILDSTPPSTALSPLSPSQDSTAFLLMWDAEDNLAGIDHFELQQRLDDGAWENLPLELEGETRGVWLFGEMGHRYSFRIRGIDRAGNEETYPTSAEVETFINPCSPDAYEEDGSPEQATWVDFERVQFHNFCGTGDEDWIYFWATQGHRYVIETDELAPHADTVLTLYDADGTTVLAENDDIAYPENLASRVEWTAQSDGLLYVRVRHYNDRVAGDAVTYAVQVGEEAQEEYRLHLPVMLR